MAWMFLDDDVKGSLIWKYFHTMYTFLSESDMSPCSVAL